VLAHISSAAWRISSTRDRGIKLDPDSQFIEIDVIENERLDFMLYTIAVVLLILWLLGLVTSYTLGGFIHILLVVAVVMILVNIISGRRAL